MFLLIILFSVVFISIILLVIKDKLTNDSPIFIANTNLQHSKRRQPKLAVTKNEINDGSDVVLFSFESLDDARKHEKLKINKAKKQDDQLTRPEVLSTGFLYCAKTKAVICEEQIECLKIGFSTRNPKVRVLELNEDNHVDQEFVDIENPILPMYPNMVFELTKYYKIKGCYEIEQLLHSELTKDGYWLWAELFTVQLSEIDTKIKNHIQSLPECQLLEEYNS